MLICFCVVVYSITVMLMIIGVEINKTFMCCFECIMESLFHPCSCIVETWFACYAACNRRTVRVDMTPYVTPPPKEIDMVVIVNPNGLPLQIGAESV